MSIEDWETELTAKQRAFVREYLIDLNATQAAIRAGYSESTARSTGAENLTKPAVASAIEAAMKLRAERTDITADRVLKELAKIGFADIRKAVKWQTAMITEEDNPEGGDVAVLKTIVTNTVQMVASEEIDDDTAAAIAEVSQNATGGVKIKLHDKRAALVDIGKHLGMFKERVELTGKDGGPIQTEVSARDILAGKLARLSGRGGTTSDPGKPD